jgi:putative aldouronate transport system permease protein
MAKEKIIKKYAKRRRKRLTVENVIFTTFLYVFLIILCIIMLYPMLNQLAVALSDGHAAVRGGIHLWPRQPTLHNFRTVLGLWSIVNAFWISVARTLVGAVTNILATSMLAYAISRREYVLAKFITVVFILTMYFDPGIIPGFMLIRNLGMLNTFSVYWVPGLVGAFNLIIMRTFIKQISESLVESAKLDGAGDFRIYWQVILPLCKPVLATVALFVAVHNWNSWFDVFLFNSQAQHLSTLQFELYRLLQAAIHVGQGAAGQAAGAAAAAAGTDAVTPVAIRAAVTIVAAVPILVVYPFLQRYFVTGIQLGGVKG